MSDFDRDYLNPIGIPRNISEEAGTLELNWVNSNITETSAKTCLFDIQRGSSRLILHTIGAANLVFSHWSTRTGIREASVNLKGLNTSAQLYIALTWSMEEIFLFVADSDHHPLRKSKGLKRKGSVLMGKDGELCLVGDEGIDVPYASMRIAGQEVVSSDARMIWDLTETKVSKLFEGFTLSSDYLFKTTLAQQCLVMLVTGFEVYTQERFGEIERFNIKRADTEALIQAFDKKVHTKTTARASLRKGIRN